MRLVHGTLPIIILGIGAADSFITRFSLANNCLRGNPVGDSVCIQRQFARFSSEEVLDDNEVLDDIDKDRNTSFRTLLTNDQSEHHWREFCEDADKVMEGLVSPAPESFRVIHSVISKINSVRECDYLDDLKALSSFLVKPNYAIELYYDSGLIMWRLNLRTSSKFGVIYPSDFIQEGKAELWHEYNTLQLSQMALDLATKTPTDPQNLRKIHDIAQQAEKRLILTLGSDLRGPTSSYACFNFALAGVQHSCSLFQTLCCIGKHELKRTGLRASFQPKNILHMVEKNAACDIQGQHALDLYHIAGACLEKKGYKDAKLIENLKNGSFGFHSPRPLIWLWRFSSRQKKLSISEFISKSKDEKKNINWAEMFFDTSKPLVVDVGSGMGASLLNLSTLTSSSADSANNDHSNPGDGALQMMAWSEYNYAGADLNQAMVNFGNGIISRDTTSRRMGRVRLFCLSAEEFLRQLQFYPGGLALIMINFPSPYRLLEDSSAGNSQLPSKHSKQFMVTKKVLASISGLLPTPDREGGNGLFLFQTKCEDVAVHVKNECLSLGTMECVPCKNPVKDIDLLYNKNGKRPKRVDEWLKATPSAERAEGNMYLSTPCLPTVGQPETEAQCNFENTVVHRCIFRHGTK